MTRLLLTLLTVLCWAYLPGTLKANVHSLSGKTPTGSSKSKSPGIGGSIVSPCGCDESELVPFGTFEDMDFELHLNSYFQNLNLNECEPLPYDDNGDGNSSSNTPGIINEAGNIVAYLAGSNNGGERQNPESIFVPLCRPIPAGCIGSISFDYIEKSDNIGFPDQGFIEIYGTQEVPCAPEGFADCSTPSVPGDYHCIYSGISVYDNTNWNTFTIEWENNSGEDIHFLTISNNTLNLNTEVIHGSPVLLDNISVGVKCGDASITNPESETVCTDEPVSLEYEVCVDGDPPYPDEAFIQISLPAGVEALNGTLVAPGVYELEVTGFGMPDNCVTGELVVVIDGGVLGDGTVITLGIELFSAMGCQMDSTTQEITLMECKPCPDCTYYLDLGETPTPLSTLIANNVAPFGGNPEGLDLSGECLSIAGTLLIDQTYTISGGEMQMLPGSEIVVGDNQLLQLKNINENGGIHACDTMWQGITMQFGSELITAGNIIQDAHYAIWHMHKAAIDITNTTFIDNYIGYYLFDDNFPITLFNISRFLSSTFKEEGPLLPPFPGQTPLPGMRSYAGVYVVNSKFPIQIGYDGPDYLQIFANRFESVGNGIISRNTALEVYNTNFFDIEEHQDEPYDITGFGIHNVGGGMHLLDQRGNNFGNTAGAYSFQNCKVGIYSEGTDVSSGFNNMDDMLVGYHIKNAQNRRIDIQKNDIEAVSRGVMLDQNAPSVQIAVTENDIDIGILGVNNKAIGIDVREDNSSHINTAYIADNNITANTAVGINVINATNYIVKANDITLTETGTGIYCLNTNDSEIGENIVEGVGTTYGVGISMYNGDNSDYYCNLVSNLETGWYLRGIFTNTFLQVNTFRPPFNIGLHYESGVDLNPQINQGNLWEGNASSYATAAAQNSILSTTPNILTVLNNTRHEVNVNANPSLRPPSFAFPNLLQPWGIYENSWFPTTSANPPLCAMMEMEAEDDSWRTEQLEKSEAAFEEGNTTASSMRLSPNPASEEVTIQLPAQSTGFLYLIDPNGSIIQQVALDGRSQEIWQLTGLASGIYMVVWADLQGRVVNTERIIVNK